MSKLSFILFLLSFVLLVSCSSEQVNNEMLEDKIESGVENVEYDTSAQHDMASNDSYLEKVNTERLDDSVFTSIINSLAIDTAVRMNNVSEGKIAFYCARRMNYDKTYDAHAVVTDLISDEKIKSVLITRILDSNEDVTRQDLMDNDFLVKKIAELDFVEVTLKSVKKDGFEVVEDHHHSKQKYSKDMEGWHWLVTPTSTDKEGVLLLNIYMYDSEGVKESVGSKTYRIKIKVEASSFFHNTWVLMMQNPSWTIGTIILPLLAFLYGKYTGKRAERKLKEAASKS